MVEGKAGVSPSGAGELRSPSWIGVGITGHMDETNRPPGPRVLNVDTAHHMSMTPRPLAPIPRCWKLTHSTSKGKELVDMTLFFFCIQDDFTWIAERCQSAGEGLEQQAQSLGSPGSAKFRHNTGRIHLGPGLPKRSDKAHELVE